MSGSPDERAKVADHADQAGRRAFSRTVPVTLRHTGDRHHLEADLRSSPGWTRRSWHAICSKSGHLPQAGRCINIQHVRPAAWALPRRAICAESALPGHPDTDSESGRRGWENPADSQPSPPWLCTTVAGPPRINGDHRPVRKFRALPPGTDRAGARHLKDHEVHADVLGR